MLRGADFATLIDMDAGYLEMRKQHDSVLEAARAEAQAIVARAQEEYDNASLRGYEHGFQQALSHWQERALRSHADAASLERRQRDRLAEVVALAVEQIVATADPAALFARAAAIIEPIVADSSPVQVRVHQSGLAGANGAFEAAARGWRDAGCAVRLLVSADETLEEGACLIETDLGVLDASVSLQLGAMRDALARAVRSMPDATRLDAMPTADGQAADEATDWNADKTS
ncbi:type III secretion system stator protein SctL [Paraburkholderia sp. SARCC-3016]|uniref:type III secretion system stator protein SctL n=1 Tax=Paraburkholderia sp. SARCC-3016 TaxID=3058611 RepID=UPI002808F70F|nr:type III secretion system stator protein SctL [Paraburkholderia sp. SARCC-3016]MDQ7980261.1 type III secretion system stator protein SctL [Paraburkholderia sp. SARCC-3016]